MLKLQLQRFAGRLSAICNIIALACLLLALLAEWHMLGIQAGPSQIPDAVCLSLPSSHAPSTQLLDVGLFSISLGMHYCILLD